MTNAEAASLRLRNLGLAPLPGAGFPDIATLAEGLGALQAQDYPGTLWALGARLPDLVQAKAEAALAESGVVRSWPMRGTLHLVPGRDLRWMLRLLAPRIVSGSAARRTLLELDDAQLGKSRETLRRVLSGGRVLGREELLAAVEADGVSAAGGRGYHLLFRAALDGVVCGVGDQLFALLDEKAPPEKDRGLEGEAAAAELARRYFTSHGPATLKDFAGWTGLPMGESRAALAANAGVLESVSVEGAEHWTAPVAGPVSPRGQPRAFLLPGFDEFILGYKNRAGVLDPAFAPRVCPGNNGMFLATLVLDGRVRGTWKKTLLKKRARIVLDPFDALSPEELSAARQAADAYGRWTELEAELA